MAVLDNFGLHADGMRFPVFSDYMQEFQLQGEIEFGSDFELDTETPLGQFFEIFAFLFEGNSNLLQNIYNSFFIYTMQGQMLDRYATNFNITRLSGRSAYGSLNITGTPNYIVSRGFQVRATNGLFYTLSSNVRLDSSGNGTGQIVANELGSSYNTEANTINEKATGDENVFTVTNPYSIINGSDIETDIEFRARIIQLFQGSENASVNGIRKAMLELTQVTDCKVLENNTNVDINISGVTLEPGEITVIIKGLIDEEVAEKLFNSRSAGIRTVGNVAINLRSHSNQVVTERLYSAEEIDLLIKVENTQLYSGTSLDVETAVKEALMNNIAGTFGLGTKANYEKILAAVYSIEEIEEATISIAIPATQYIQSDIEITPFQYLNLTDGNITVVI